jgi:hypothetical protein
MKICPLVSLEMPCTDFINFIQKGHLTVMSEGISIIIMGITGPLGAVSYLKHIVKCFLTTHILWLRGLPNSIQDPTFLIDA